jgi:hypothetical protein
MNNNLPNPNPYQVLNVSSSASNTEITKAMKMAMVQKKHPLNVISQAHKSLLNPQERIIADYLREILPPLQRFQKTDLSELENLPETLDLLPELDNIDKEILEIKNISESDKKIGQILFSQSPLQMAKLSNS